jgi:hypothetical protein
MWPQLTQPNAEFQGPPKRLPHISQEPVLLHSKSRAGRTWLRKFSVSWPAIANPEMLSPALSVKHKKAIQSIDYTDHLASKAYMYFLCL